jgi:hypothetical protein
MQGIKAVGHAYAVLRLRVRSELLLENYHFRPTDIPARI